MTILPRPCPPPDAEHTATFAVLQKYARVNLLRPVDTPHMWHAAMQSKACELTVLGTALLEPGEEEPDLIMAEPDRAELPQSLAALIEQLAAVEHERWSHWQRYIHEQCREEPDGSLTIPAELVRRWDRQMRTAYADLSETEKQSDREQVLRYLQIIATALQRSI